MPLPAKQSVTSSLSRGRALSKKPWLFNGFKFTYAYFHSSKSTTIIVIQL